MVTARVKVQYGNGNGKLLNVSHKCSWKNISIRRFQMEIPGLSYLKYADATLQGLNSNTKAQHAPQKLNSRELQRTTARDPI